MQEGRGVLLSQARQDFGIGQARGVIDGHMQVLMADPSRSMMAGVLAGDAMADAVDLAQGLDIEVDQLAGRGALVADHLGLRIKRGQPSQTQAAQHQTDGGARHAQGPGDLGSAHPLSTQLFDTRRQQRRGPARTSPRRRAAVVMPSLAAKPMPAQPFVRCPDRDAGGFGRGLHRPAAQNAVRQQGSTRRG